MAALRGKSRQASSPQAASIGAALKARRMSPEVNKRQEDVALDADLSQKIVSQIELGQQDIRDSGLNTIGGILRALNWTAADLQRASGVDLGLGIDTPPAPVFPEALYPQRDDVYVPESLLEAVAKYGDDPSYADLRDPSVQRKMAQIRGLDGGPETAAEWFRFYLDFRPWLDKKN